MPGQTSRKVTSRARVYPSLSATAGLLQWTRLIGAWTPAAALPEQWIILLLRGCEIPVNPATNSLPYLPDPERPLAKHCRKRPLAPRCIVHRGPAFAKQGAQRQVTRTPGGAGAVGSTNRSTSNS